jgi:carbonic anhydrase/SulP family sulfate permease
MAAAEVRLQESLPRDLISSIVVFLVALPLCLGIALASGAPLFSGLIAGIVGGIVVGLLSGSHTSVSGPAAGLTAVVATQIATLGSFEAFLAAVVLAGVLQIGLSVARGGFIAAYFPSSVIKGLLAAIGVILILKQLPHLIGHDVDPVGEMAFLQPNRENTFSELSRMFFDLHPSAALIGLGSLAFLIFWDRVKALKSLTLPPQLVVVVVGVLASELLANLGGPWVIGPSHLVQVPVAGGPSEFVGLLVQPDFSVLTGSAVYVAAVTIALVASLETLLNLEAVDALDPHQRRSDPNRELLAQGVGNLTCGLVGGLPVTSVVIRGTVNIQSGARTKLSAVLHGVFLLGFVAIAPGLLNRIPLSALAAILLVTGFKLASPTLFREMAAQGRAQLLPFVVTVGAIVFTDLLIGIAIGLANATAFILYSNVRRPLRRFKEQHVGGEILRIELANQVSFLNRAALMNAFDEVPGGGHVMLDATDTDYIDPDVLGLIQDFAHHTAPARGVQVSLKGFKSHYEQLEDRMQFVDYTTRELQAQLDAAKVLRLLREGNERFRTGRPVTRDLTRQMEATSSAQYPLAAVLSCIDSRTPAELIFDLGLGDIFSVRIAGNVAREKVLGSLEYASVVAGAKLILVLGHTSCGAVNAAVDLFGIEESIKEATQCDNLELLIHTIQDSIPVDRVKSADAWESKDEKAAFADEVAYRNVRAMLKKIREESPAIDRLVREGRVGLVGGIYDVGTGEVEFFHPGDDVPALAGAFEVPALDRAS